MDYKTVKIGKVDVKYLQIGQGEPLLFLHGYGGNLSRYHSFLEVLAQNHEVFAPLAYGINYFRPQPKSLEEYAELTLGFHEKVIGRQAHLVGHSIGGTVALIAAAQSDYFSDVIVINPLLPVNYGIIGFGWKVLYKAIKKDQTFENVTWEGRLPFILNFFQNPFTSLRMINHMSSYRYEGIEVRQPALILYGEDDHYFNLDDKNSQVLSKVMVNGKTKRFPRHSHVWPIHEPNLAYEEITGFLEGIKNSRLEESVLPLQMQ